MYARIDIRILKTLVRNGDVDINVLQDMRLRVSYQQKMEIINLTISTKGLKPTVPMLNRMRKWYRIAPTLDKFGLTENMVNNLHDMNLIDRDNLVKVYNVKKEDKTTDNWFPFVLWWFQKRG